MPHAKRRREIFDSGIGGARHSVEWYAEHGLPDIARRFRLAAKSSVAELLSTPQAGTPKLVANVQLKGLRTWSV
jgi:hypothetical protein